MATYIRLTDYKSSYEKEQEFFNPENRYEAKQEDFKKLPENIFVYWINRKIINLFTHSHIGNFGSSKRGLQPGDVNKVIRFWNEVNLRNFAINIKSRDEALSSDYKWFKFSSGGSFRKWFGNDINVVDWKNNGETIKNLHNPITPSQHLYFTEGIVWSKVSSGLPSFRLHKNGIINGDASPCLFSEKIDLYIFAFMNSKISSNLLDFISPTLNFKTADIDKLPIVITNSNEVKQQIDHLTQQNINISKEEWDSRETSWDFTKNELIKHKSDTKIETAYTNYSSYWKEQHNTLHQNEEELNRLFIDIYELQDELTADVELKDITILKNETKIIDDELVFQANEIMKQFISYGVGVMFGRYSLDSDGLLIANMGQGIPSSATFEIDDDNVIPVLEDDYFKDDIAARFVQFVKTTFGEENLSENIRFIEESLGATIRKYFVKGFYEDHIKRYKKRPIYWMVASPKKGFMSLIYMHRYQSDVFARVRNSYLTEYIAKLEAHKETLHLTTTSDTASNKDKKDADKQIKSIDNKLKEVIAFDRDKMMSASQNPIEIDLDDGVKVNYCTFKEILYPITGLCK